MKLNHFDKNGNAVMVDVSGKEITVREAKAKGSIHVNREVMKAITEGTNKKGDVLGTARIAGIMGAKKTSEMIPMCHLLMLNHCSIDFEIHKELGRIDCTCKVRTEGKTGVEMEALTGVNIALLTIYDMCKAADKYMTIKEVYLDSKTGGKSGDIRREDVQENE